MGALYQLTSPSGKRYIGITVKTAEKRWAKHVEHALGKRSSGAIYSAIRKYGPENFEVRTLVIADDRAYLRELETKAIVALKTRTPNGYNVALGGYLVPPERSAEFKAKVSVAQKRRFQRPDQRALLEANLRKAQEAHRKKWEGIPRWKKKRKEHPMSQEEKGARISAALATPEIRAKVLECAKQRSESPT